MTRVVSVGRSKGLFAIGALGSTLLTLCLAGCPGTLLNPSDFPPAPQGTGGSTGTAGMTSGTAGAAGTVASGTAGVMGGPTPGCDITPLFLGPTSKYGCSETAICHDASGGGANFSMVAAGWMTRLVGVPPKGGGGVASICAKDPAFMGMPYIISKSATGDGLLMQKLKAAVCSPGGVQMPFAKPALTAADLTCAQMWTTALANQ